VSGALTAVRSDVDVLTNRQSDAVTDYAAGNLSPAKHALMACVVETNPAIAAEAALKGSYRTDTQRYFRGDLHIADETTDHAPYVEEGEDCICLVVTQGQLHMKSWLPRLIQQVVGI